MTAEPARRDSAAVAAVSPLHAPYAPPDEAIAAQLLAELPRSAEAEQRDRPPLPLVVVAQQIGGRHLERVRQIGEAFDRNVATP